LNFSAEYLLVVLVTYLGSGFLIISDDVMNPRGFNSTNRNPRHPSSSPNAANAFITVSMIMNTGVSHPINHQEFSLKFIPRSLIFLL